MSTATETIPVTFAGVDRPGTVPAWARGLDAKRATVDELCKATVFPEIAVVQSTRPKKILEDIDQVSKLFEALVVAADLSTRIILGFKKANAKEVLELAPLLARHPGLSSRIELALRAEDLQDTLLEAYTKLLATRGEQDPLGEIKFVAATGRALRSASGRLDAKKVAAAFGIPLTELARQIGLSKQRISKTSDSEALQPALRPYERIARLRSVLSAQDFKVWLNTPNEHLEDGDAPLDYLKAGAQEPLAHFAENMLTGATT